jgi:protein transport protein SEC61 subunit alpha
MEVSASVAVPIGGAAYYLSPPRGLGAAFSDPFHALFYAVFIVFGCAAAAKTWVEISGSGPRDVARMLREQKLVLRGHRETSYASVLSRAVPTAAALGGLCVGALALVGDLFGVLGGGAGA